MEKPQLYCTKINSWGMSIRIKDHYGDPWTHAQELQSWADQCNEKLSKENLLMKLEFHDGSLIEEGFEHASVTRQHKSFEGYTHQTEHLTNKWSVERTYLDIDGLTSSISKKEVKQREIDFMKKVGLFDQVKSITLEIVSA